MGIYTWEGEPLDDYREEFAGLDLRKSCIRFHALNITEHDTLLKEMGLTK